MIELRRSPLRRSGLVVGLLLAGCAVDLKIPDSSRVSCSTSTDCPARWICDTGLGQCVASDKLDKTPPAFAIAPTLEHTLLAAGQTATLTFDVTETLREDPEVVLHVGTGRLFQKVASSSSGNHYVFAYTARGSDVEPEGVDVPVTAALVDPSANASGALSCGSLRFDSSAPTILAGTTLTGSPARATGELVARFTVSEELLATPTITLDTGEAFSLDTTGPAAPAFVFRYAVDGSEEEGTRLLEAELTDLAGNSATRLVGELRFDRTAPGLAGAPVATPARATTGTLVVVSLTVTEPLGSAPVVDLGGLALSPGYTDGLTYSFSRQISHSDGEGAKDLHVALRDVAGNDSGVLTTASIVSLDFQPPSVVAGSVALPGAPVRSLAASTSPLLVSFTVDERLDPDAAAGQIAARIAGLTAVCAGDDLDLSGLASEVTCVFSVPAGLGPGDALEGQQQVYVDLADALGNRSDEAVGTVAFDFTPPAAAPGSTSVQLVPDYPRANPLYAVTKATGSTTINVSLALTESLAAGSPPPTLVVMGARDGGGALTHPVALAVTGHAGNTYTFAGTLGSVPADAFTSELRLAGTPDLADASCITDSAGNLGATAVVGSVEIDTTAPASPDTATSGRVVLERVPWGAETPRSASPQLSLAAEAGAVTDGAHHLAVYAQSTVSAAARLAVLDVDADGGVAATDLGGADRPVVWVTAVDDAGNESAPAEVLDVVWTASLGFKVPGDTSANPTTFSFATPREGTLTQGHTVVSAPPATALQSLWPQRAGGVSVGASTTFSLLQQAGGWPAGRAWQAMAFARDTGMMLLFGGTNGSGARQDVWQWDGALAQWSSQTVVSSATGTVGSGQLVRDSRRGRYVLVLGTALWEWDDGLAVWTQATVVGNTPPARTAPMAAFDDRRGELLLFGGEGLSDLWAFDFSTHGWTERSPAGAGPSARARAGMVYDSDRGTLLIFGGCTSGCGGGLGGASVADTWEWRPDSRTWAQVSITGPSERLDPAMAYDSTRHVAVLYGGQTGAAAVIPFGSYNLRDHWEWAWDAGGATGAWSEITTSAPPSERAAARMVFDGARGRPLLFGGVAYPANGTAGGNPQYRSDLYELDPRTGFWRSLAPTSSAVPVNRMYAAAAYDESTGSMVIAGGGIPPACVCPLQVTSETWRYDAFTRSWTQLGNLPDVAGATGERRDAAAAFDPARGHVVVFGGWAGDPIDQLAELTGGSWTVLTPSSGSPPPARYAAQLATDPTSKTVVLFGGSAAGGSTLGDLWLWNGNDLTWSQPSTSGTPPVSRAYAAMTVAPSQGRLVLFGGVSGYDCGYAGGTHDIRGDTWELDLTSGVWTERHPTTSPPARMDARMVYDEARGTAILFGGRASCYGGPLDEVWEWDTELGEWFPVTTGNRPTPRSSFALVRDGVTGVEILAGGSTSNTSGIDVWTVDLSPSLRPAALWEVPFRAAEPPASFGVLDISCRALTGADGRDAGAPQGTPGAILSHWDSRLGQWVAGATGTAGSAAPEWLTVRWSRQQELADALSGAELAADLAITPRAGSVDGALAPVETDALELTVRYHRGPLAHWELDVDGDAEGWVASGVTSPGSPSGGIWTLTLDQPLPFLTSPPVDLLAAELGAFQARVAGSTAVTAHLHWLTSDDPVLDDTKSVSFVVPASPTPVTVRVPLTDNPAWQGEVVSLRLELDATVGQTLWLDWIRLTD